MHSELNWCAEVNSVSLYGVVSYSIPFECIREGTGKVKKEREGGERWWKEYSRKMVVDPIRERLICIFFMVVEICDIDSTNLLLYLSLKKIYQSIECSNLIQFDTLIMILPLLPARKRWHILMNNFRYYFNFYNYRYLRSGNSYSMNSSEIVRSCDL